MFFPELEQEVSWFTGVWSSRYTRYAGIFSPLILELTANEEHDFFTAQPVKDADVFLLRCIMHNWGTALCIKILRLLREAAIVGKTRLIVVEQIVQYACKSSGAISDGIELPVVSPTPEFLLPNVSIKHEHRDLKFSQKSIAWQSELSELFDGHAVRFSLPAELVLTFYAHVV